MVKFEGYEFVDGGVCAAEGFTAAGVIAGIKAGNTTKRDLAMIFCGKSVTFGIKVSHSHRRSNRTYKPNVKKVKAIVNGTPCRVNACTRCLRSGLVQRAV